MGTMVCIVKTEWVRWFALKILRGDTNGVGEDEVTVTSGLHALAEGTKTQKTQKRKPHPMMLMMFITISARD